MEESQHSLTQTTFIINVQKSSSLVSLTLPLTHSSNLSLFLFSLFNTRSLSSRTGAESKYKSFSIACRIGGLELRHFKFVLGRRAINGSRVRVTWPRSLKCPPQNETDEEGEEDFVHSAVREREKEKVNERESKKRGYLRMRERVRNRGEKRVLSIER